MAEYIEREAAIKRFNFAVLDCLGMEPTIRAGDIIKALESIPAADVRPVVRGKWKQDELAKRLDLYVCSECGQPLQIVNADGGKTATAYCPNCGADMREESDAKD